MESMITSKYQVTIPREIRKRLRLKPGDRVKFFIHPDGSTVLLSTVPIAALRGIVKSRQHKPVKIDEMNEAIIRGAAEGFRRR